MINRFGLMLVFLMSFFPTFVQASAHPSSSSIAQATAALDEILKHNKEYISKVDPNYFKEKSKGQSPKVTVVGCSDSRVHTHFLDETPEGNLFIVRNIGNQVKTATGSVEYGVNHLKTPLLLILGHSQCGAISEVMKDYSNLEHGVISELDSINIKSDSSNIEGVEQNVHNQVQYTLQLFAPLVKAKKLLIVGGIYDFADDMKKGAGNINIINIQGKHVAVN